MSGENQSMQDIETDCDHPKCHEFFRLQIQEILGRLKVLCAKKVGWWSLVSIVSGVLIGVGIPLFMVGAEVWSDQGSDPLKYATKFELSDVTNRLVAIETAQFHYQKEARGLVSDLYRCLLSTLSPAQKYDRRPPS